MSSERGYCSTCFKYTKHKLIEQNYVRRNVYECDNCKSKTLQCRMCGNFTRGGENWDDELCAEHNGLIANFKNLDKKLNSISDYEALYERESINMKQAGTIAAVTVGGVAMVTPLAFAAAPAIGGAIGSTVFGLSGAAATSSGLAALGGGALAAGGAGMAGGAMVVGAVGGGLGGLAGGVVSNSYVGNIKEFGIHKIKDGQGPGIIFINGFLTQEDTNTSEWEKQLKKLYPDNPWYHVTWESKRLYDLGKSILSHPGRSGTKEALEQLAKKATKEGAKKLGPLAMVFSAFGIANNPWSVAMVKAEQTGVLLSDIIARTDKRFILCGHSLGARVIYKTLAQLSTKKKKYILDAHLLGGAIGSDKKSWKEAKNAVSGKIVNYWSSNDYVLLTMYKLGTFFISSPIGRNKIEVSGIMNIDTTPVVGGHTEYVKNFSTIFPKSLKAKARRGSIAGQGSVILWVALSAVLIALILLFYIS